MSQTRPAMSQTKSAINQHKSAMSQITIIGAGKVGQSLTQLMNSNGLNVQLLGRDSEQQYDASRSSDIVLLTVADTAIENLCKDLSKYFKAGAIVAHCSGALSSSILESAKLQGCFTASLHPLNTFPSLEASLSLFSDTSHGTYLYTEGEDEALSVTQPLFQRLGFQTVELRAEAKTAYHAACVFACNYLTVLMDLSLCAADSADLDKQQFWCAIQPLIQNTISNLGKTSTSTALSGPIARGDTITVQQHIELLKNDMNELDEERNSTLDSYLTLGRHALILAEQRGELSSEKLAQLKSILKY